MLSPCSGLHTQWHKLLTIFKEAFLGKNMTNVNMLRTLLWCIHMISTLWSWWSLFSYSLKLHRKKASELRGGLCHLTCSTRLLRGTDPFSLRLSNRKRTTANTTVAIQCEWLKIIPIFCQIDKKNVLLCCRILVISVCVPWDEKGWKLLDETIKFHGDRNYVCFV